jgi:ribonuclease BN (tRNA processing enzyme)
LSVKKQRRVVDGGVIVRCCGTRGYVEEISPAHRDHSALLLMYRKKRLLLDAGQSWAGRVTRCLRPDWIAITHAHPDHAFGIGGVQCPVYVTATTRRLLRQFPEVRFETFQAARPFAIGPFRMLAYRVVHSLRAPAVGFLISAGRVTIAYNPDVVYVPGYKRIFRGIDLYIGDGATLSRPLVRRQGDKLFGHTTVRAQLGWCARSGVALACITHCGKQIVTMPEKQLEATLAEMAAAAGVRAIVARDGLELRVGIVNSRC